MDFHDIDPHDILSHFGFGDLFGQMRGAAQQRGNDIRTSIRIPFMDV